MKIEDINDNEQYRVELRERVEVCGQVVYPGHNLVLRGDVLKTVAESVTSATPIGG